MFDRRFAVPGTLLTVAAALLVAGLGGRAGATAPTPPADCYVAPEPSQDGPAAPTNLTASWSPYYDGEFLLDAEEDVSWSDKSDDETCFVLEISQEHGPFEPAEFLPPNETEHYRITGYLGHRAYRVYAATATARSEYSNVDTVTAYPSSMPVKVGDINCDDKVDGLNLLALISHDAGFRYGRNDRCPIIGQDVWFGAPYRMWGDFNCNDSFSHADVLALLNWFAGLPYEHPPACTGIGVEEEVSY